MIGKDANKKDLTPEAYQELLSTLKTRFEANMNRHSGLEWAELETKLDADTAKRWSLGEMERTGGEPDVTGYDQKADEYIFTDCSAESPAGRRSLCYDQEALTSRKENRPVNSAMNMAAEMGIEMLTQDEYKALQQLGSFDMKTSSWIKTSSEIRKLGGALFADYRYGQVFIYHNGVESYYGGRGFRGTLRV